MPGNWAAFHAGGYDQRNSDGRRTLGPGEIFSNNSQHCARGDLVTTLDSIDDALHGHASQLEGCETTAFMPGMHPSNSIPEATLDHLPTDHSDFVSSLDRSYAFNPGIGRDILDGSRGKLPQALQSNPEPLGTIAACSTAAHDVLPPPPPPPEAPNFNFDSASHSSGACLPPQPMAPTVTPQPAVPSPASSAPSPVPATYVSAPSRQAEAQQRAAWAIDSVLEIYSTGTNRWNVAHVTWVTKGTGIDVLTLQFYQPDGAKNKSLYRNDHQLAPLGAHCGQELPPGCQVVGSQSRPGQFSFFDSVSGVKYETVEQVWKVFFERASKKVLPVGPPGNPAARSVAPPVSAPRTTTLMPTPSFPAEGPCPELAAAFTQMLPHMQAHMGSSAAQRAATAAVSAPRDPKAGGKVALPGFNANPSNPGDELLITNGLSLAAQLMGGPGVACGMTPAVNGGTVRRFELVK